jgi:hypothetical protein
MAETALASTANYGKHGWLKVSLNPRLRLARFGTNEQIALNRDRQLNTRLSLVVVDV